jgi:hypothetical protein
MKVNIEVKSELYCVLGLVTGANQLIESPTPYDVGLGHFECLELSRSHLSSPLTRNADYHLVAPAALKVNPSSE